MNMEHVWVVTYWDFDTESVVTVFNNEVVAINCYNYFEKFHNVCCLDKCPIYSTFKITGIVAEGSDKE